MLRPILRSLSRPKANTHTNLQPVRFYAANSSPKPSKHVPNVLQPAEPHPTTDVFQSLVNARANPASSNESMYHLFQTGLNSQYPKTRRFAALYVVHSALRLPPHPRDSPLALPLVQQAVGELDELCKIRKDPAAMTLKAQVLEVEHYHNYDLIINIKDDYYKVIQALVESSRWPAARHHEDVITPGDFYLAYARYHLQYDSQEEALVLLKEAVSTHNHLQAAIELEPHLEPNSLESIQLLHRLAVSGHAHAAKRLGDLCLSSTGQAFESLPSAVRQSISTPKYVNLKASEPPPYSYRFPFVHKDTTWLKRIKYAYESHYLHPNFYPEAARDLIAQNILRPWMQKNSPILAHTAPFRSSMHAKPENTAKFRALDWYRFASLHGDLIQATVAGFNLAVQLELPYESGWWEVERQRVQNRKQGDPNVAMLDHSRLHWLQFIKLENEFIKGLFEMGYDAFYRDGTNGEKMYEAIKLRYCPP